MDSVFYMLLGLCRSGESEKDRKKTTPVSPEPSGAKKVGDGMFAIVSSGNLTCRNFSIGSQITFLNTILDSLPDLDSGFFISSVFSVSGGINND